MHCGRSLQATLIVVCFLGPASAQAPRIERRLPPPGIEISDEDRQRLTAETERLKEQLAEVADQPLAADVEVFVKAVDFALRHNEFYNSRDVEKAEAALRTANQRLAELKAERTPWTQQRGLLVRGYRSAVDDSVQPYGLVIPENLDFDRPAPLYVWLHGRGDKSTDLHFIADRQTKVGQIEPPGAIVLHPFGRQCIGYKSAGETDIGEAIAHVAQNYSIDPSRIVLMGFSMGGAGAWHYGAHHASKFVAMSPGAGFAETARYQNLRPANYPSEYEQTLWRVYDVPNYARNLFNIPVVAYSGELDKQIQAARVMEQAYREQGRELPHVIGPGMGHKYHPDSLAEILRRMDEAVQRGQGARPTEVMLQTQTLRYPNMFWVQARGLRQHWNDSRIDAKLVGDRKVSVTTKNISALRLTPWKNMAGVEIEIDGQNITLPETDAVLSAVDLEHDGLWKVVDPSREGERLRKQIGLQGPIDDAFLEPFLVVTPSGRSANERVQEWIDFELQHLIDRWQALFRGNVRVKRDVDVTEEDESRYHLVVWGTPETNRFLKHLAEENSTTPIRWTDDAVQVGKQVFDGEHHVPVFIYPRGGKYLVVNSGPTFREGHDRTNSLQNPKLPDWAVLDIRQLPNELAAGKVVAADFFDEEWQLKE